VHIAFIEARESTAVIPPWKNRTETREYNKELYKELHLGEYFGR
jgi:hypothetical protein